MAKTSVFSKEEIYEFDKQFDSIICDIKGGNHILFLGPGGCGKSFMLKKVASYVQNVMCENIAIVAPTGIAAVNLNDSTCNIYASTIHKWAGIGLGNDSKEKLAGHVRSNPGSRKRWSDIKILFIDEISMLGSILFTKLEYIARFIRNSSIFFGGIKLITSGDFMQLKCVKDDWLWTSEIFDIKSFSCFIFETPFRYPDLKYFELLLRLRVGKHTEEDITVLESRVKAYHKFIKKNKNKKDVIKPTKIESLKSNVDHENEQELNILPGELIEFEAIDSISSLNGKKSNLSFYEAELESSIPKYLSFKVGAQVMLRKNLDVEKGLCNGSRGVVTSIYNSNLTLQKVVPQKGIKPQIDTKDCSVDVKFKNTNIVHVVRELWEIEDKYCKVVREQIPLILAWSITIHKSQGMSIDCAIINAGSSIFTDGQLYVALSRIREISGLYLSDFYSGSIMTSIEALDFINDLSITNITEYILIVECIGNLYIVNISERLTRNNNIYIVQFKELHKQVSSLIEDCINFHFKSNKTRLIIYTNYKRILDTNYGVNIDIKYVNKCIKEESSILKKFLVKELSKFIQQIPIGIVDKKDKNTLYVFKF